jgi:hypothetical protein
MSIFSIEMVEEIVDSEAPPWEPEPFELPLVEPLPIGRRRDDNSETELNVIVIDLA